MKKLLIASALTFSMAASFAQNHSTASQLSGASLLSAAYLSVVVPSQAVKDVGKFLSEQSGLVVRSVSNAGQHSVLAITNASGALVATVSVVAGSVAGVSTLVGQGVRVVAEASGHSVYAGSQLIAFIPNEIAKSLVHHEKIKG